MTTTGQSHPWKRALNAVGLYPVRQHVTSAGSDAEHRGYEDHRCTQSELEADATTLFRSEHGSVQDGGAVGEAGSQGAKTHYKDSWMENMILGLCVHRLGKITGVSTTVKGYDGFVELTRKVMQSRSPLLQRASSMRVLHSAIPTWLLKIVKRFIPNNTKTAETFAAATLYAEWLVGPCEVKEVEVKGVVQKSGVLIKKCRYLESSNCVGLCVNMCKIPTQDFFTNSLGVPVTMTPNFEDMSCEMIYGQAPPSIEEDPALQQPCFATLCPTARKKAVACPKTPPPS